MLFQSSLNQQNQTEFSSKEDVYFSLLHDK